MAAEQFKLVTNDQSGSLGGNITIEADEGELHLAVTNGFDERSFIMLNDNEARSLIEGLQAQLAAKKP